MIRDALKAAASQVGLRITRDRPANRFDAMADTLAGLAGRGFCPTIVVDAGANVGAWARLALRRFPSAAVHAIEPQPECAAALASLASEYASVTVHAVAITEPGRRAVRLAGAGTGSTGAHVVRDEAAAPGDLVVPAETLDALVAAEISPADRVLVKFDLEGHEVAAFRGAERLLAAADVVITEVAFYPSAPDSPTLRDVCEALWSRGFVLYDVAALSGRPRDGRLRLGDAVFVREATPLTADRSWT